jgi:hypothetical protein
MSYEDGMFEDEGIMAHLPEFPGRLLAKSELSEAEPVVPLMVRAQELIMQGVEYSVDAVRRHRKASATLGGAILGSLGFATGAAVFSHRH